MIHSRPKLHAPIPIAVQHRPAIEARFMAMRAERISAPKAARLPGQVSVALTTVSLNSNVDAYIDLSFVGALASATVSALVDSGNTMLIVPRWEDIASLPDSAANYQVLGAAREPWGCPANIVKGPIVLNDTSGETYTIADCVFYACTGDPPSGGDRTANFGTGCITPWTASGWNTPAGISVTMQSPLSYDVTKPFAELKYAPATTIFSASTEPTATSGCCLTLYEQAPVGYSFFGVSANLEWMSIVPLALKIGGVTTSWPGHQVGSIAMVDTGGGPVFLSDPNDYVCKSIWPDLVTNPDWTSTSQICISTSDDVELQLGDSAGNTFTYEIDPAIFPPSAQGLTLVMCELNAFMMGRQGLNTGGITALVNDVLVDYRNARVGLRSKSASADVVQQAIPDVAAAEAAPVKPASDGVLAGGAATGAPAPQGAPVPLPGAEIPGGGVPPNGQPPAGGGPPRGDGGQPPGARAAKDIISQFFTSNAAWMLSAIVCLVFLIIIGSLFVGSEKDWSKTMLHELSDTTAARGLITFLIAVATVAIAIILTIFIVASDDPLAMDRFTKGKEVLSILIGVLGTIVGFYFGASHDPSPNRAGPSITSVQVKPEQPKADSKMTVTATTTDGALPLKYAISFSSNSIKPVEGLSATGKISEDVQIPNSIDDSKPLDVVVEVTDKQLRTATTKADPLHVRITPSSAPAAASSP